MTDIIEFVHQQEEMFTPVIADERITWAKESQFAIQAIQKSDFLAKVCNSNRISLQNAIINVAAIGITLNPAAKLAYLVPRDGGVCLDISYMGLLHLAQSTGSIMWGQCKLVHANDNYANVGLDKAPEHSYNPFADRGAVIGGYCTVKTHKGDYLTEEMSLADIEKVAKTSKSYNSKHSPWKTFWEEMARKTIVKRASKYWPKVERLDTAIDYLNNSGEGIETEPELAYCSPDKQKANEQEQANQLAGQVQEFIDKMEMAESEYQLKAAFQPAFKMTTNNKEMQQQVQQIYAKNKQRLGL